MFGWTEVEGDWLISDGIDSGGARNRPTDRQLVLVLCLPWYLSDFSLIWFLLIEPAGGSWWAWVLWTVIFCSSCFRPGYKTVLKRTELDRWLLEQKVQQLMLEPTSQSFTHCPWITVHRKPYICLFFLTWCTMITQQSFRHHGNGPWTFARQCTYYND